MAEISPDKVVFAEGDPEKQLTYKQFKQAPLETLTPGTIVMGVSPSRLFASQDWTDAVKTVQAMNDSLLPERTLVVPAYVSTVYSKQAGNPQRVLVVGDRHHHALAQWEAEKKVNVKIVGTLPAKNHIGFSVLRQKAGSPFRGM